LLGSEQETDTSQQFSDWGRRTGLGGGAAEASKGRLSRA